MRPEQKLDTKRNSLLKQRNYPEKQKLSKQKKLDEHKISQGDF